MNYKTRIPATIMAVLTHTVMRRVFLICALFSLAIVAPAWSATKDQPIPIAVLDTFNRTTPTAPGFDVSFAGVFTSIIGPDVATGTSRMDVKFVPGAVVGLVHCKFTWVRSDGQGTLVLSSVCVLQDGHGTWHVESGTGRYENFKASGTETFGALPPGGPFAQFERFAGIGTNDERGGNGHEGNQ